MLYIEKEGLSGEIDQKLIELHKSEKWKAIKADDTKAIRVVFENEFPRNEVKKVLIHEQHGLCAYCMRRIRMDQHCRIEHLVPLSKDKEKAIDYRNMLGVCDGGEKRKGEQEHILCCDAHKSEEEMMLSPLNRAQMDKIAYDRDGRIFTQPKDQAMEDAMNDVLRLNGIQKEDGTFKDTSTELLKGRRDAYERARRMLEKLHAKGKCNSATIKKLMDELYQSDEWEEYAGVKLYYFRKKYQSLVRRGM